MRTAPGRGPNRPISVYRFLCQALTLCPQPCMGIQPGARFPARSADALTAALYGHPSKAIYRYRPIEKEHSTDVESVSRVCAPV
jgi:hypothetical protein